MDHIPALAGPIRFAILLTLSLVISSCGGSNLAVLDETVRSGLTAEEITSTNLYLSFPMDFISLKKGEIVGEDIFKREVKKSFHLDRNAPGRVAAAGPGWIRVDFGNGIALTFFNNNDEQAYRTQGWGTITIGDERFDVRMGVMTGSYVDLLMPRVRE